MTLPDSFTVHFVRDPQNGWCSTKIEGISDGHEQDFVHDLLCNGEESFVHRLDAEDEDSPLHGESC